MAEELRYDIEGQEVVSTALMELLNSYPNLQEDSFQYATLGNGSGKAIFPTAGSAIRSEVRDVTGHVEQLCEYPFTVVYRASGLSEGRKEKVKEWLDNLGRWLEKQPIIIGGEQFKLSAYPKLTRGREFRNIERYSPAFLDSVNEDKAENWAINMSATYTYEFNL